MRHAASSSRAAVTLVTMAIFRRRALVCNASCPGATRYAKRPPCSFSPIRDLDVRRNKSR
jgi:hypothetical protein